MNNLSHSLHYPIFCRVCIGIKMIGTQNRVFGRSIPILSRFSHKFVQWRKISGRSTGKLWRLTSPFLYALLHPQATHLLPPLDWVVGVSSAIVQGTIVGKQSVQIRGKVTKYQNIVTFQCTHILKSIIGRFHREILIQSGEKSHCFLLTKMAALTPWRHGSSRANTAWFKSRSSVNSGFRQISRKVMVRSQ